MDRIDDSWKMELKKTTLRSNKVGESSSCPSYIWNKIHNVNEVHVVQWRRYVLLLLSPS